MTQKNRLAAVTDNSMIALCNALVGLLMDESRGRGWNDVTERLKD